MKLRVCYYSRVSTEEQNCEVQLRELRAYGEGRGWVGVEEVCDVVSGAKANRPGLTRVLDLAREKKIDAVVVTKIDRIARSVVNFCNLMAVLDKLGVGLICTTQNIDTSEGSATGKLMRDILVAFAAFERELIRDRTRAGLEVARAAGKKLGRPSKTLVPEPERTRVIASWLYRGGVGLRQLAKDLGGVGIATAARYAQLHRKKIPIEIT